MTNRELVRLKIDDQLTEAHEEVETNGHDYLFELDFHPVQDYSVKIDNAVIAESTAYTLNKRTGKLKTLTSAVPAPVAAGKKIIVDYNYAAFLDEDIDQFLSETGDSPLQASIKAVRILLSSSARRFDYQQGHTSMQPSQVFEHLKDLLESLISESNGESGGGAGISFGTRSVNCEPALSDSDLSRSDQFPGEINQWSRDL